MSKNSLKPISQEITVFNGVFLTSSHGNWADVENYVNFSSKEILDIKIDDNCLIEEIRRLNVYLNYNKLENQHAEIDKRWVEILNHFKNEHIPYEKLVIFFEFTLRRPGTNALVLRVFSVGNLWTGSWKTAGLSKSEDFINEVLDDAASVMNLTKEERHERILRKKGTNK
ncbi:uncharacterized protein TNCV_448071 [Trichonephila clavipes]|nr:uncharacterized protein TNCV_448071 [Trichonephila clavipes]